MGGDSDHHPVFLQILGHDKNTHSPFKFNAHWLEHEDLVILLKNSWRVYDENSGMSLASQFSANLKRIKDVSICWFVKRKEQDLKDLVEIEILLKEACNKVGFGYYSKEDKESLVVLESRKRIFYWTEKMRLDRRVGLFGYFVGMIILFSSINLLIIENL